MAVDVGSVGRNVGIKEA